MEGTRHKLLKGAAWIGAAKVLVSMIGIVSTVLLARLLVPADFGLVAIAGAAMALLAVMTEFSLAKALVQMDDPSEDHFHTAWTMNAIRGVLLAGLIVALSGPLAAFYGDERLREIFWLVALTAAIGSLANPKLAVFERELQFHQAFIMGLTSKLVGFAVTVGIALYYRSYWALVIGPLASEAALLLVSYKLYPFAPRLRLNRWRELWSFSVWLTLGRWVQSANWRADPLVLGYFFSPALLGFYSVGNRISSQTIQQVTSPVQNVLFPAFSRLKGDADRFRQAYLRSQGVLCLLVFPVGVGFSLLAEEIVPLALGDGWAPAIPIVQILATITVMQMSQNVNPVAMATGDTRALLGRDLRVLFIRWPLVLLGVYLGRGNPFDMLLGAVIGRAISVFINTFWNMQLIAKVTTIDLRNQLAAAARPALAALAMVLAVLATRQSLENGGATEDMILRATVLVPVGALAYGAAIAAFWFAGGRAKGAETEAFAILRQGMEKLGGKLGWRRADDDRIRNA